MSWKPESEEIETRRSAARELGGSEAVEAQHARGRLTIRERLDALIDEGSLEEQAPLAGETETDEEGILDSFFFLESGDGREERFLPSRSLYPAVPSVVG